MGLVPYMSAEISTMAFKSENTWQDKSSLKHTICETMPMDREATAA